MRELTTLEKARQLIQSKRNLSDNNISADSGLHKYMNNKTGKKAFMYSGLGSSLAMMGLNADADSDKNDDETGLGSTAMSMLGASLPMFMGMKFLADIRKSRTKSTRDNDAFNRVRNMDKNRYSNMGGDAASVGTQVIKTAGGGLGSLLGGGLALNGLIGGGFDSKLPIRIAGSLQNGSVGSMATIPFGLGSVGAGMGSIAGGTIGMTGKALSAVGAGTIGGGVSTLGAGITAAAAANPMIAGILASMALTKGASKLTKSLVGMGSQKDSAKKRSFAPLQLSVMPGMIDQKYPVNNILKSHIQMLGSLGHMTPAESMMANIMLLVEKNTRPIGEILFNLLQKSDSNNYTAGMVERRHKTAYDGDETVTTSEALLEANDRKLSNTQRTMSKVETTLNKWNTKYNPAMSLANTFAGKSNSKLIREQRELMESGINENYKEESTSKEFGITVSMANTVNTSALQVTTKHKSLEGKMFSLAIHTAEIQRQQLIELITIRKEGFGINRPGLTGFYKAKQAEIDEVLNKERSFKRKTIELIGDTVGYIPLIGGLLGDDINEFGREIDKDSTEKRNDDIENDRRKANIGKSAWQNFKSAISSDIKGGLAQDFKTIDSESDLREKLKINEVDSSAVSNHYMGKVFPNRFEVLLNYTSLMVQHLEQISGTNTKDLTDIEQKRIDTDTGELRTKEELKEINKVKKDKFKESISGFNESKSTVKNTLLNKLFLDIDLTSGKELSEKKKELDNKVKDFDGYLKRQGVSRKVREIEIHEFRKTNSEEINKIESDIAEKRSKIIRENVESFNRSQFDYVNTIDDELKQQQQQKMGSFDTGVVSNEIVGTDSATTRLKSGSKIKVNINSKQTVDKLSGIQSTLSTISDQIKCVCVKDKIVTNVNKSMGDVRGNDVSDTNISPSVLNNSDINNTSNTKNTKFGITNNSNSNSNSNSNVTARSIINYNDSIRFAEIKRDQEESDTKNIKESTEYQRKILIKLSECCDLFHQKADKSDTNESDGDNFFGGGTNRKKKKHTKQNQTNQNNNNKTNSKNSKDDTSKTKNPGGGSKPRNKFKVKPSAVGVIDTILTTSQLLADGESPTEIIDQIKTDTVESKLFRGAKNVINAQGFTDTAIAVSHETAIVAENIVNTPIQLVKLFGRFIGLANDFVNGDSFEIEGYTEAQLQHDTQYTKEKNTKPNDVGTKTTSTSTIGAQPKFKIIDDKDVGTEYKVLLNTQSSINKTTNTNNHTPETKPLTLINTDYNQSNSDLNRYIQEIAQYNELMVQQQIQTNALLLGLTQTLTNNIGTTNQILQSLGNIGVITHNR